MHVWKLQYKSNPKKKKKKTELEFTKHKRQMEYQMNNHQ